MGALPVHANSFFPRVSVYLRLMAPFMAAHPSSPARQRVAPRLADGLSGPPPRRRQFPRIARSTNTANGVGSRPRSQRSTFGLPVSPYFR